MLQLTIYDKNSSLESDLKEVKNYLNYFYCEREKMENDESNLNCQQGWKPWALIMKLTIF